MAGSGQPLLQFCLCSAVAVAAWGGKLPDERKITVLVCDDSELACIGLRQLLQRHGYNVIGSAKDGLTAVENVSQLQPDVVLMDVLMPHMGGIQATCEIKKLHPGVKVLMMTASEDEQTILAALASGADGYCFKQASMNNIVEAIKVTALGATWLDPGIAMRVLKNSARDSLSSSQDIPRLGVKDSRFKLSPRELEVLQLVVEGLSNTDIAARLVISGETVKTHMRHIMEKLAVADRTQAAVKALREGLLPS